MKLYLAGAAALLALGAAASAQAGDAYKLNPPQTSFTATGNGAVTGPAGSYSCTVSMTGSTAKSVGQITGLTFSGAPGCENVIATGLPWHVRPISLNTVQISHVALSYAGLGRCGPNQIKAVVTGGNMSIQDHLPSKEGVCNISASLTTSPSLSITQ